MFLNKTLKPVKTLEEKTTTLIFALSFCILWVVIYSFIVSILGYPYKEEAGEKESLGYFIFYTWFFAPIWEELAFRYGPIELSKRFGRKALLPTIVLSSCIFGWGHHNNPESVLLQGVLGFIFSIVYVRNGLIWSMILHSIYNIFVTFF